MKYKLFASSLLIALATFSMAPTAQAQPFMQLSGIPLEDTILWTFSISADSDLLNQQPYDEANGVVSAQFKIEVPAGLLIPGSVQVLEGFTNPIDPTLIDDPGLDPYSAEIVSGAAMHFSVDAVVEVGIKDAIFLSFGSTPFEDAEPRPALSFSTYTGNFCGGGVAFEGMLGQAGQSYYAPYIFVDVVCDPSLPGDCDGSWNVSQSDLDLVLLNWGVPFDQVPPSWLGWPPTGPIVGQDDLDAVLLNWGTFTNSSIQSQSQQVPEPVSGILLLIALSAGKGLVKRDAVPRS